MLSWAILASHTLAECMKQDWCSVLGLKAKNQSISVDFSGSHSNILASHHIHSEYSISVDCFLASFGASTRCFVKIALRLTPWRARLWRGYDVATKTLPKPKTENSTILFNMVVNCSFMSFFPIYVVLDKILGLGEVIATLKWFCRHGVSQWLRRAKKR